MARQSNDIINPETYIQIRVNERHATLINDLVIA